MGTSHMTHRQCMGWGTLVPFLLAMVAVVLLSGGSLNGNVSRGIVRPQLRARVAQGMMVPRGSFTISQSRRSSCSPSTLVRSQEKPEYEKFMDSPVGNFIQGLSKSLSSGFMGQGKVAMIKAMAGDYDEAKTQASIDSYIKDNKVLMFSFTK